MARRRRSSRPTSPRRKPLILLAEDYEDAREMYSEYLRFAGLEVIAAGDGLAAIRLARTKAPDLILMDLRLPLVNGFEATRRLKADPATAHIPVLALTAHGFTPQVNEAKLAGCNAVILKPCLPAELVAQIREALNADRK